MNVRLAMSAEAKEGVEDRDETRAKKDYTEERGSDWLAGRWGGGWGGCQGTHV